MDDETITSDDNLKNVSRSTPVDGTATASDPGLEADSFEEPDLSGTTFGHYRLTRKIAEGGMGVVYEAMQIKLDRKVAFKILTNRLLSRPEFLKRFEREAKSAAALNHPNLVQVYDFGEASGRHYLVMEYVEGEDLAQHVQRRGKVPVAKALEFVEQAALALKAACAKSIIHRDIKPSNLMLTREGIVKVSDMGLAKILTEDSDVTVTGVGMGSPHFIAPEQADDSRHVDHRVDIYALGITLLYLVTGKKPFDGTSPFAVVLAHVNKPLPTGKELGTELPEEVEALIRRMAAKKADHRYQDYSSLIEDIQRTRRGEKVSSISLIPAPVAQTVVSPAPATERPRTNMPADTAPSVKPILLATVVGVAAALLVVGVFAFFIVSKLRTPDKTQAATPQQNQNSSGQVQDRGFPREREGFRPEDRRGPDGPDGQFDGPPGDGDAPEKHIARIMPVLPEIKDPLTDESVDAMFAAAEKFAKENPEKFREIIPRFDQVSQKAIGTPLQSKAASALHDWSARRDQAAEAMIKIYKAKVTEITRGATDPESAHRQAMDYVWTFPDQLRSRKIDLQIFRDVAVRPPGANGQRPGPGPNGPGNR
jgi:serine/threonine protein kinase